MKSNNLINTIYLEQKFEEIDIILKLITNSIKVCNALNTTMDILRLKKQKMDLVLKRIVFTKLMLKNNARACDVTKMLNINHSTIQYYISRELKYDNKLSELYYKTKKKLNDLQT
jgi:hypothetical protein